MEAQVREVNTSEEEVPFDIFVKAKVSKSLYKSKKSYLITKELSLELLFFRQILSNPSKYAWKIPIAYLIPLVIWLPILR